MDIKEIYKTLLIPRYNNKKYYNMSIEFDNSNNVIRIASPNCSTRLILKPIFIGNDLIQLEYALSGDMFAFTLTEYLIDYLINHTKEESKSYLYNLMHKINTDTNVDAILQTNIHNPSINKILGYFNTFVNSYWN